MSINQNVLRIGSFTSSEIFSLMSNGKKEGEPGKTFFSYIEEKRFERKLGRSLDVDINARPLVWGRYLEDRVNQLLGTAYQVSSQETSVHPDYPYWAGSTDGIHHSDPPAIAEIKCPMTLKSFCRLADCLGEYEDVNGIRTAVNGTWAMDQVRKNHPDGEKFFWQIASNGCIRGLDYGELIFYIPFQEELSTIRIETANIDDHQLQKALYWLNQAEDEELPYIIKGGYYNNLNVIRFKINDSDKELLTSRVKAAGALLI